MIELLERFTIANVIAVLTLSILMWLIWPVLCGALGARHGQGVQGAFFGLLLGPLGLMTVLLSKPKRICPMCGKRTLSPKEADATNLAVRQSPHQLVPPRVNEYVGNSLHEDRSPDGIPIAATDD